MILHGVPRGEKLHGACSDVYRFARLIRAPNLKNWKQPQTTLGEMTMSRAFVLRASS